MWNLEGLKIAAEAEVAATKAVRRQYIDAATDDCNASEIKNTRREEEWKANRKVG